MARGKGKGRRRGRRPVGDPRKAPRPDGQEPLTEMQEALKQVSMDGPPANAGDYVFEADEGMAPSDVTRRVFPKSEANLAARSPEVREAVQAKLTADTTEKLDELVADGRLIRWRPDDAAEDRYSDPMGGVARGDVQKALAFAAWRRRWVTPEKIASWTDDRREGIEEATVASMLTLSEAAEENDGLLLSDMVHGDKFRPDRFKELQNGMADLTESKLGGSAAALALEAKARGINVREYGEEMGQVIDRLREGEGDADDLTLIGGFLKRVAPEEALAVTGPDERLESMTADLDADIARLDDQKLLLEDTIRIRRERMLSPSMVADAVQIMYEGSVRVADGETRRDFVISLKPGVDDKNEVPKTLREVAAVNDLTIAEWCRRVVANWTARRDMPEGQSLGRDVRALTDVLGKDAFTVDDDDIHAAIAEGLQVFDVQRKAGGSLVGEKVTVQSDGESIEVPILSPSSVRGDAPTWVPTFTLARLSELARDAGEELALSEADVRRLAPLGRHLLAGANIRQGRRQDGHQHHFVRAKMMLMVIDEPEGVEREVDLPVKQFGMLIDALGADVTQHWDARHNLGGTYKATIEKPRWVGSQSFNEVWRSWGELTQIAMLYSKERRSPNIQSPDWATIQRAAMHPRSLVTMDALERMQRAHVLSVDIDVYEGAPEWESVAECWRFAQETDMPFDPLYLDLTSPGGLCPLIEIGSGGKEALALQAALIWRAEGALNVIPIGWPTGPLHNLAVAGTMSDRDGRWPALGRVVIGGDSTPTERPEWRRIAPTKNGSEMGLSSVIATFAPMAVFADDAPEGDYPGRIDSLPPEFAIGDDDADSKILVDQTAYVFAQMALLAAGRALAVLAMLEAINISIEPGFMSKDDRRLAKRAEKRGWPIEIAKTVTVRQSKSTLSRNERGDGEGRVYSHAFWRRGHYAFYPLGTKIADKLASENPQDRRLVNHPDKGLCRKVFRGPTIIGRTDADGTERRPIEKTRVWKSAPRRKAA